jgi:hypothetical protein
MRYFRDDAIPIEVILDLKGLPVAAGDLVVLAASLHGNVETEEFPE